MSVQSGRPADRIKAFHLKPELDDQLKAYADENNISKSDALRGLIQAFIENTPNIKRRRRSRRISVWIDPTLWAKFSARARKEKVTVTELIEHALEAGL